MRSSNAMAGAATELNVRTLYDDWQAAPPAAGRNRDGGGRPSGRRIAVVGLSAAALSGLARSGPAGSLSAADGRLRQPSGHRGPSSPGPGRDCHDHQSARGAGPRASDRPADADASRNRRDGRPGTGRRQLGRAAGRRSRGSGADEPLRCRSRGPHPRGARIGQKRQLG